MQTAQKRLAIKAATLFLALACPFAMGFTTYGRSAAAETDNYFGMGTFTTYSETINYEYKETTTVEIPYGLPFYSATTYIDSCAPLAGTVLVGYYDRFCENLVPDYKTYIQFGSRIIYRAAGTEIDDVFMSLYDYMDADGGTTYAEFNRGMSDYAESKGYAYSRSSVSLSNLGGAYETAIEAGKPVAVFLSGFSLVTEADEEDGKDVFEIGQYNGNHVVAAYGYKIDRYYDSDDNLIATRTYLSVINGGGLSSAVKYLCLDGRSNVIYSIAVTIS